MPHVISKSDGPPPELDLADAAPAASAAVRTLAAARDEVARVYREHTGHRPQGSTARAIIDLPEEGGTIALADGTVIAVQPVSWVILYRLAGRPSNPGSLNVTEQQVLDAYNALVLA